MPPCDIGAKGNSFAFMMQTKVGPANYTSYGHFEVLNSKIVTITNQTTQKTQKI